MKIERVALSMAVVGLILVASIAYKVWVPPAWEYTILSPSDYELKGKLSEMGREGWEIASARRALNDKTGIYELIFKRPAGAWHRATDARVSSTTSEPSTPASYSYTPPVSPDSSASTVSYPAPDDPRAKQVLRACVNGKAVALEKGKWVPYSISGTALNCVVEP